ncbi:zinc finger protein 62-like [Vanessa tameamea]|uniref:Zinc finger protein 62-like n=1 Tax=Vanessa tameamea TaxID=334116 RepID=A0A8B8HH54_VANTA
MEQKYVNIKELKTYRKTDKKGKAILNNNEIKKNAHTRVPLTTQNAVKYLLEGTLRLRVCRYCLNVTSKLSELDEMLVIAVNGSLHEVTVRDMVASIHPFKITEDRNFPNKICSECLTHAIGSYLFSQQCERAERALRNCFDDMYEKFEKLDPLEPVKRRGKRKMNLNHNILYTEHEDVINYAEPIINLINVDTMSPNNNTISELECQKCSQVLPNTESLLNHEKSHPKSMWYNCRLCGKSFVKQYHLRRHLKENHILGEEIEREVNTEHYKCSECGTSNKTFVEHLQHIEKHKFKETFRHLIERRVDDLCSVCLDKGSRMVNLGDVIHLHGGYPELTGDRSIRSILRTSIPEITFDNYTGTKICDICLNHAITSHVFIARIQYVRNRLNTCVSLMLDSLNNISHPNNNIMVEISQHTILPSFKLDELSEIDDSRLNVEVLEDEFRIASESDSDFDDLSKEESSEILFNPAKNVTKTYVNKKLVNGYQTKYDNNNIYDDICSEFLTFKKKIKPPKRAAKYRYTCPLCNKHFISDYFLKKHILKHVNRKVQCNLCLKQFKSKFYLFEHKKMVHVLKQENFISCKICGRSFLNINKIKMHQKCHKIKECQLCDKSFKSQKHYDVHMQRHAVKFTMCENRDVQTCSFCEKPCSNENELSLHVNKIHLQIKPYSCDMCDKQFYTEYNLSSHKKLHSLFSKELCVFCNKTLKCRKELVVHVRKHIGSKPHQCPVCRHSFYSDCKMKRHMKVLHGGKYCCRLCRTVLPSQIDLKNHINVVHSSM